MSTSLLQFQRVQNAPVIAKGATYDGTFADALAAPRLAYNGTSFAACASVWNIANGKWYEVFFTATDPAGPYTYVSGSLLSPTGGNYLIGDGGLEWFEGAWWFAYVTYASTGLPTSIYLMHSTDLLTWSTPVAVIGLTGGSYDSVSVGDPQPVWNPNSSKLEIWYNAWNGSVMKLAMADSPDGVTWTREYAPISAPNYNFLAGTFGSPSVCYVGSARYVTSDVSFSSSERAKVLYVDPAGGTSFTSYGTCFARYPFIPDQAAQAFDSGLLSAPYNRGDGYGLAMYSLVATGPIIATTDNTESDIVLMRLLGDTLLIAGTLSESGSPAVNNVALTWVAATGGSGTGYTYNVNRSAHSDMSSPTTLSSGQSGTTYANTSVVAGTWYYQIEAFDSDLDNALSNILMVVVSAVAAKKHRYSFRNRSLGRGR